MCERRWCTGTSGMPVFKDRPFAKFTPTSNAPMSPGAAVTAMASMSESSQPASVKACFVTCSMHSACLREAISGTTPP